MIKHLLGIASVALVTAAVSAQEPAPKPVPSAAPAGNVETGKTLWVSVGCWQCHGYEGQGGAAGPRLSGRNLPWAGFNAYVRRPTNQMPPYTEKVVSNADLAHMLAYVNSRPAPPKAVPELLK
jgi:ubiquinol-cytochrome c reductase cytochrome c subunit